MHWPAGTRSSLRIWTEHFSGQGSETGYNLFMQVAQKKEKLVGAHGLKADRPDPFSSEARARRQKLIAAINAGHSEAAEQADAILVEYLEASYPETVVSRG